MQAIWSFAVLAGVVVLAYLASRYLGLRAAGLVQGRKMQVLEVLSVGPRRQVCLLKVGARVYLLGLSDQFISRIAEFVGDEAGSLLREEPKNGGSSPIPGEFGRRLRSLLSKAGGSAEEVDEG